MKVRGVGDDDVSVRALRECAADELGEQERQCVGDKYLVGVGADEGRESRAKRGRHRHPTRALPTAYQSLPPLVGEDLVDTPGDPTRNGTKRVPVEIDLPLRENELLA